MSINTEFGNDLKSKLVAGIDKLDKSVSSTLGPSGRNVLIENQDGTIQITKDGVTVAKAFHKLEDPTENISAQLLKQVSIKAADKAGDGTTTATLLAAMITREGFKRIQPGSNPVEVKKGIDKAVKAVVNHLKSISRDISSEEQIRQVATLSANGDVELGKIIALALDKVGRDGLVTIEQSKDGSTSLESVEGLQFDRGYKSPYFVTDNRLMQSILEEPNVLIYDGNITMAKQIIPFITYTGTKNESLLIIANDIDGEAIATLIVNKAQRGLKICAVKSPGFGETRVSMLNDIAILTGGTVLSKDQGHILEKVNIVPGILGKARMATIGKDETTIIDSKGDIVNIQARLQEIKDQIDKAKSPYEIEKLQDRLSKMTGGVAIINIGGLSEVEIKERMDRADDSLHATKAAIEEGIVPGGGMALMNCLDAVDVAEYETNDEIMGGKIVKESIQAPFRKILDNAGEPNHYKILSKIQNNKDDYMLPFPEDEPYYDEWEGYNVKTGVYEYFLHTGVIDPTKVTRTALENAASVAGVILTTESVVYTKKDPKKDEDSFGGMDNFM